MFHFQFSLRYINVPLSVFSPLYQSSAFSFRSVISMFHFQVSLRYINFPLSVFAALYQCSTFSFFSVISVSHFSFRSGISMFHFQFFSPLYQCSTFRFRCVISMFRFQFRSGISMFSFQFLLLISVVQFQFFFSLLYKCSFGFHKMLEISWLAESLLASQAGLCSMQYVSTTRCSFSVIFVSLQVSSVPHCRITAV